MPHPPNLALPKPVPELPPFVEFQESLSSRVEDIPPVVDRVMQCIKQLTGTLGGEGESHIDTEMALVEAIANGVIHGNLRNAQKRVYVTCRYSIDGEIMLTIRDEGQGFDTHALPDPTTQDNLLLTHGRGIRLMQALMDEVEFEERGTVVRLRKRLRNPVNEDTDRPGHSSSAKLSADFQTART